MKKIIYTLGVTALLGGAAYAADNYTCATPPSCASLGYTLTSTTNCVGTVLKCPFDTSRYYCTQKKEVLQYMQLDWGRKQGLSYNQTYYPSTYGCVWGNANDKGGGASYVSVNGAQIQVSNQGNDGQQIFFCVGPGDYYRVTVGKGESGLHYIYFIPYKGN